MTARQHAQVMIGNALLTYMFQAIFECWIQGVAAIMEHPAKAWWSPHLDRLPSVWDTWPARVLTTLPGCQLTHLNQDQYGQVSKKPTTLLSVHTSGLASALGRWAQPPPCARVATSKLKIYPERMCRALAEAVVEAVTGVVERCGVETSNEHSSFDELVEQHKVSWDPYQAPSRHRHDCKLYE